MERSCDRKSARDICVYLHLLTDLRFCR